MLNFQEYYELVDKMIAWAKAYYQDANPLISDEQWDKHYRELELYEAENSALKRKDSPVGKVGFAMFSSQVAAVEHNPPMLSLKNAMDVSEALALIENNLLKQSKLLVYEHKADGIACRLTYQKGLYVRACTRGDGIYGEDITKHVQPNITGFSPSINLVGETHIDGELIIKYKDFETLNAKRIEEGKEPYKNTRNAVAGMLRSDDLKEYEKEAISFLAYELHSSEKKLLWSTNRAWLASSGFEVIDQLKGNDFEKIAKSLANKRDSLQYMIDGIVVKIDDYKTRERLGSTQHSPRWAFSYKFPAQTAKTVLESISFTVGRTGQMTGMAYFKPVDIGGVSVSKSAIDSLDRWNTLQLREGSELIISRRADVRPYVESASGGVGEPYKFTHVCTSCSSSLSVIGKKVYCTNIHCSGRNIAHITYAVSKEALDIRDISLQIVSLLYSNSIIKRVPDIYKLKTEHLKQIGMTDYYASILLSNISASKQTTLDAVIASLGINSIAKSNARLISNYLKEKGKHNVSDAIATLLDDNLVDELPIGQASKEKIKEFTKVPLNEAIMLLYPEVGFVLKVNSTALRNEKYAITGSLLNIKRSDLESKLLKAGATIQGGVTSETIALITDDDPNDKPSTKMAKALELGIKIMTSKDILEYINSKA